MHRRNFKYIFEWRVWYCTCITMFAYSINENRNIIFHALTDDGTFGYSVPLSWCSGQFQHGEMMHELFMYKHVLYLLVASSVTSSLEIYCGGPTGMPRRILRYKFDICVNDATIHDYDKKLVAYFGRNYIHTSNNDIIYICVDVSLLCIDLTKMRVIDKIHVQSHSIYVVTNRGITIISHHTMPCKPHTGPTNVEYLYTPEKIWCVGAEMCGTELLVYDEFSRLYKVVSYTNPVELKQVSEKLFVRAALPFVCDGIRASMYTRFGTIRLYREDDWSMYEIDIPDMTSGRRITAVY